MSPSISSTHIFPPLSYVFPWFFIWKQQCCLNQITLIHLHILKTDTYSEMWTKMSLPPSDGVRKPWPLEREKHLHTPVNTGPCDALAVLWQTTTEKNVIYG